MMACDLSLRLHYCSKRWDDQWECEHNQYKEHARLTNMENKKLLLLLPREMWEEIVSRVNNLKTLAKLYLTCKMFHNMFANDAWLRKVPYFAILGDNTIEISTPSIKYPEINDYKGVTDKLNSFCIHYKNTRLPFSVGGRSVTHSKNMNFIHHIESFSQLSGSRIRLSSQLLTLHKKVTKLARQYVCDALLEKCVKVVGTCENIELINAPDRELDPILRQVSEKIRNINPYIVLKRINIQLYVVKVDNGEEYPLINIY